MVPFFKLVFQCIVESPSNLIVTFHVCACGVSGELISQGHMCLWCHQRSKLFGSVRDVQKHMVDKGHCKMKHDETNRHEYADFYDYR